MPHPQAADDDTAQSILSIAERLVQTRGFNAFSYADIASELGITKASLHYHFPTKVALGAKLISRYSEVFQRALDEIAAREAEPRDQLAAYVEIYESVLRKKRMCLCGMLAADYETLPRQMRDPLKAFFDANETWLASVLEKGRKLKQLRFAGAPVEEARVLVSALEGAMLVARSYDDASRFTAAAARLLAGLKAAAR